MHGSSTRDMFFAGRLQGRLLGSIFPFSDLEPGILRLNCIQLRIWKKSVNAGLQLIEFSCQIWFKRKPRMVFL